MAAITTALIKELRERTGVGMMDCKKALAETDGDIEAAIENLRKAGAAAAAKKAGRIAAEGVIAQAQSADGSAVALVEVNSETDFAAKHEDFKAFAASVAQAAVDGAPADVDALKGMATDDGSVEEARQALITKIGENLGVRRFERFTADGGVLGSYLHGVKIGVVVKLNGGDAALAKDVAMHIAASNPTCISEADMPAEVLERRRKFSSPRRARAGNPTISSKR